MLYRAPIVDQIIELVTLPGTHPCVVGGDEDNILLSAHTTKNIITP